MRVVWTFVKIVIALALAIPLSIIVLATALGILGALVGFAILAVKVAVIGLIGWGAFRLITSLVRGSAGRSRPKEIAAPPKVDPYYESAMRELDRDLGVVK